MEFGTVCISFFYRREKISLFIVTHALFDCYILFIINTDHNMRKFEWLR